LLTLIRYFVIIALFTLWRNVYCLKLVTRRRSIYHLQQFETFIIDYHAHFRQVMFKAQNWPFLYSGFASGTKKPYYRSALRIYRTTHCVHNLQARYVLWQFCLLVTLRSSVKAAEWLSTVFGIADNILKILRIF